MKTSDLGKQFIVSFEKVRLTAYDDGCGVQTIGIGRTKGVKPGDSCTRQQAYTWFYDELARDYEPAVNAIENQVPLTQEQYDALVSFCYNAGVGALNTSTLRRKLLAKDYAAAAAQFDVWNKGRVNGQLVVIAGLVTRRTAERKIFEKGIYAMHDGPEIMTGVIPNAPNFSDVVSGVDRPGS